MILQRLVEYYDRLAADPNDPMTPTGFSREKISFALVIAPDGSSAELVDVRDQQGRKFFPRIMPVPDCGGRSSTGLKPNFLWDNSGYALGRDSKGNADRSRKAFESFRDFHQRMAERIDDPELTAVARFLAGWSPERADALPLFEEAIDKNIVFRVRGNTHFVHQSPAVVRQWKAPVAEGAKVVTGQSLVSGDVGPIARLHPMISGVTGTLKKGAAIASFNRDAFTSHGLKQTYNAPVSVTDAFKYTTALNRLLENRRRRMQLGDSTVVFWAERPTLLEDVADAFFGDAPPSKPDASPEDLARAEQVRRFLSQVRDGHSAGEAMGADSNVKFYILGLSPNVSRISVRFWVPSTVSEMRQRLAQHLSNVELAGARPEDPPLVIRRIVKATGRAKFFGGKFQGYDGDTVPPLLAGAIARAVFEGTPYPRMMLVQMLNRLRADRHFGHARLASIKAFLVRNNKKEIPVSLNIDHRSPAYHCGRLLCLLDYIQGQAIGNINAGIVKKYYSVASCQPFAIFGRLIALATKAHIPKLDSEDRPGFSQYCERLLRQILSKIGDQFPRVLNLDEQGEFALGFYNEKEELPDTPPRYYSTTARGEKVRSKAEVTVADALHALGINYEYERPLNVPGHRLMKPDFTVIGSTDPETVYIEYLGLSDSAEYMNQWNAKVEAYKAAGILPYTEGGGPSGRLVTFTGTKTSGINSAEIREILRTVFGTN